MSYMVDVMVYALSALDTFKWKKIIRIGCNFGAPLADFLFRSPLMLQRASLAVAMERRSVQGRGGRVG